MLTMQAAGTNLREFQAWFGPPALIRKPVSSFDLRSESLCTELEYIIDGRVRFEACVRNAMGAAWAGAPHFVYVGESVYSVQGRKLLPRMLTLAGHYGRACKYIPECWQASPLDVAAFLGVSELEGHEVTLEL